MRLTHLGLQHFRAYTSQYWQFTQPVTLIVGPNAIGKTSIIEAINLLSTGQSFRAGKAAEVIQFGQEFGRAKGKVALVDQDDPLTLEVTITTGVVQGKKARTRILAVNDVRRQRKNFVGKLLSVVFRPEDLRLIEGSPRRRRQYLDDVLSLLHYDYAHALKTYSQALVKRNKLLPAIREGEMPATVLSYWNQQLVKHGETVQQYRRAFLDDTASVEFPLQFSVEYQASVISAARQQEYQGRAVAAGHTLIGPHKDDIVVKLDQADDDQPAFDVSVYGSRGQQRLAVLWLKICELEYVAAEGEAKPILLLDDILSELDQTSRQLVLSLLATYQTFVTTTDPDIAQELDQAHIQYETIIF